MSAKRASKVSKWAGYDATRARPRVGVVLEAEVIEAGKAVAAARGESFSAWLNDLAKAAIAEHFKNRPSDP